MLLQAAAAFEEKLTDKHSAAQIYERVRGMDAANVTASLQLEAIYREQYNWQKLNEILARARGEHARGRAAHQHAAGRGQDLRGGAVGRRERLRGLAGRFQGGLLQRVTSRELERLATSTNKWADLLQDYTQVVQGLEDSKAKADLWVKIGRWYGDNLHHVNYAIASVQQARNSMPTTWARCLRWPTSTGSAARGASWSRPCGITRTSSPMASAGSSSTSAWPSCSNSR